MKSLLTKIKNFVREEEGASAVEYGLLVALIAVAIIGAVTMLGQNLSTMFTNVAGTIGTAS
jgi:pilus assembly protein Flp/PilA